MNNFERNLQVIQTFYNHNIEFICDVLLVADFLHSELVYFMPYGALC